MTLIFTLLAGLLLRPSFNCCSVYPQEGWKGDDTVEFRHIVEEFQQLADRYGVTIPCYGHAGDGNLHSRVSAPDSWSDERWEQTLPLILKELYELVAKRGGRISGEHGIGCKRLKYMPCVVSETFIGVLRSIKKALDPTNIMNPGKIFEV